MKDRKQTKSRKSMKYALISALAVPLSVTCFSLSSCNAWSPNIDPYGTKTVQAIDGNKFNVSCDYTGYYKNDINFSSSNFSIAYTHNGNIYNFNQNTKDKKIDGNTYNRSSFVTFDESEGDPISYSFNNDSRSINVNVKFIVHITLEESKNPNDSIELDINWNVQHSKYKKYQKVNIALVPKDNCVVLSQDYTDKSVPVKVDGNPEVTKTNSVNAIDHIYSAADDLNHPTPEDLSRIAQNFNNDFIYYTKLAYYNLKNILIANDLPVISELYAKLIDGSYKMSVDLRYNPVTQVFDYLKLNITARAKVLTVEIPISFYYMWGFTKDDTVHGKKIGFDSKGPKLIGAFSMYNGEDAMRNHYPQLDGNGKVYTDLPNPAPNPYNQDFLSLVPSSDDSYCLYDVTGDVPDVIVKMFPAAKIDLGYHIYDMSQPYGLGIEWTSEFGELHSPLSGVCYPDSFSNCILDIPSYYLSQAKYDAQTKDYTCDPIKIQQAELDLSDVSIALNENAVKDNNYKDFARMILNDDYISANWDKEHYNDNLSKMYFGHQRDDRNNIIGPNDDYHGLHYADNRINFFNDREKYIKWEGDIKFAEGSDVTWDEDRLGALTYKQILCQFGHSIDAYNRSCVTDYSWHRNKCAENEYTLYNIVSDNNTRDFSRFAYGLNYAFTTANLYENSDNLANLINNVKWDNWEIK